MVFELFFAAAAITLLLILRFTVDRATGCARRGCHGCSRKERNQRCNSMTST